METTLFAEQPDNQQPPIRPEQAKKGRQVLRNVTRGVGALLVRLGTLEYDSSTRVMRGTTGAFLVYLGARLDQLAPQVDGPSSSRRA